ncbi:hypothetical protein [Rhizobium sp. 'Codium 1']|uniref:hypothetical protein n=1 Tax=Rhizobium sp. 'Codium 1' TaxID=2940484 RepID=UPI001E33C347|nr:hypothetical protein [Rhizobium sp. 'Codium 1']
MKLNKPIFVSSLSQPLIGADRRDQLYDKLKKPLLFYIHAYRDRTNMPAEAWPPFNKLKSIHATLGTTLHLKRKTAPTVCMCRIASGAMSIEWRAVSCLPSSN